MSTYIMAIANSSKLKDLQVFFFFLSIKSFVRRNTENHKKKKKIENNGLK